MILFYIFMANTQQKRKMQRVIQYSKKGRMLKAKEKKME